MNPRMGCFMRPHHNARTRRSLERIRRAWASGRIPWSTAVILADRAKARDAK